MDQRAHQALCPWWFPRQEYWSGLPCPPQGDLPNPGIEPSFPALQADFLPSEPPRKPMSTEVGSLSLLQGIFLESDTTEQLTLSLHFQSWWTPQRRHHHPLVISRGWRHRLPGVCRARKMKAYWPQVCGLPHLSLHCCAHLLVSSMLRLEHYSLPSSAQEKGHSKGNNQGWTGK